MHPLALRNNLPLHVSVLNRDRDPNHAHKAYNHLIQESKHSKRFNL